MEEQKATCCSSFKCQGEYCAMTSTLCEMVWLKNLRVDLGCSCSSPMKLSCDNQVAMHIAANPVFHERTRHIEVDCHFIHQQVQAKVFKLIM